jgi:hypothetical protein
MGFLSIVSNIVNGGVLKSVENIAKEYIQTDIESAEAKALMVKTLDPNGLMRRDISRKVSFLYMVYIFVVLFLILAQSFKFGDVNGIKLAVNSITNLFVPITAMYSGIVSVSFGINVANTVKEK